METQQNPSPPPPPSAAVSITNGAVSSEAAAAAAMAGEGALYVQVITDEQMEVLRRQISVYATICEQLVEMHKAVTAHNDSIAGMRLGNIYCDPLMTPGGYKIAARQRWTPTPVQLQTLESIFDHGNGTPSKQKIKEIAHQLMQHGQISETNVYNWFQNRRARSKRKQSSSLPSNTESEAEAEAEIESSSEGKAKSQKMTSIDTEKASSDMQHYTSQEPQRAQGMSPSNSKSSGSTSQMSFYENILLNQRMDHLMGRMELPGDYSPFQSGESYDLSPL